MSSVYDDVLRSRGVRCLLSELWDPAQEKELPSERAACRGSEHGRAAPERAAARKPHSGSSRWKVSHRRMLQVQQNRRPLRSSSSTAAVARSRGRSDHTGQPGASMAALVRTTLVWPTARWECGRTAGPPRQSTGDWGHSSWSVTRLATPTQRSGDGAQPNRPREPSYRSGVSELRATSGSRTAQ